MDGGEKCLEHFASAVAVVVARIGVEHYLDRLVENIFEALKKVLCDLKKNDCKGGCFERSC